MVCSRCGSIVPEDSIFCACCGRSAKKIHQYYAKIKYKKWERDVASKEVMLFRILFWITFGILVATNIYITGFFSSALMAAEGAQSSFLVGLWVVFLMAQFLRFIIAVCFGIAGFKKRNCGFLIVYMIFWEVDFYVLASFPPISVFLYGTMIALLLAFIALLIVQTRLKKKYILYCNTQQQTETNVEC